MKLSPEYREQAACADNDYMLKEYLKQLSLADDNFSFQFLLKMAAFALVLGMLILIISCSKSDDPAGGAAPSSTITAGWTIPVPPDATLNQSYTASVPDQAGCTYLWSVAAGSATLIDTTTPMVTFTPTAIGPLQLQCVVTNSSGTSTGTYSITVSSGAVLNANPDTITVGQGTILLANFSGTGIINPGSISVTSDVGVTVTPAATTVYTLNVDGDDVATVTVTVLQFVPKFVYVANLDDQSISAFTLDTGTGDLTQLDGSPYYDVTPDQLTSDPQGKYLFAAGLNNGVYVYNINSTNGALTPVAGSPFSSTETTYMVYSVSVDPKGRFVYAASKDSTGDPDSSGDGYIESFSIDQVTGALTPIGVPIAIGDQYYGNVLVHPSGKYLYAAVSNDDAVVAFSIDQATGALTLINTYYSGSSDFSGPAGVAIDPTGAYFFAKGDYEPSYIAAFSIDIATGILSEVSDSPFGALVGSYAWHGLAFHPTMSVLYTAFYNSDDYDAAAYTLDLFSGSLTLINGYSLFPADYHGSDTIVVDRSGQFAFSTGYDDDSIASMTVSISDGSLTEIGTTSVGVGPTSIYVAGSLQTVTDTEVSVHKK